MRINLIWTSWMEDDVTTEEEIIAMFEKQTRSEVKE